MRIIIIVSFYQPFSIFFCISISTMNRALNPPYTYSVKIVFENVREGTMSLFEDMTSLNTANGNTLCLLNVTMFSYFLHVLNYDTKWTGEREKIWRRGSKEPRKTVINKNKITRRTFFCNLNAAVVSMLRMH